MAEMDDTEAPPQVEDEALKHLAPELAAHVRGFLHGGTVGALPIEQNWQDASAKLRFLHDAMIEAAFRHKAQYVVLVLTVAVRLQSVILMEAVKRGYMHAH